MENEMKVKITKVNSGLGIRLPLNLLKILGAKKDDTLDLKIFGNEIRLIFEEENSVEKYDSDLAKLIIIIGKMKEKGLIIRNIIEEDELISLFLESPEEKIS
jgi:hypothetical protein